MNLIEYGQRLHASGMISGADGNLSVRLREDRILITPSGFPKAEITPRDIVVVDIEGQIYGQGTPSSELDMHLAVYREREDINAVIHAHPPYTIASSLQEGMKFDFVPEVIVSLGGVFLADYARPGTPDVSRSFSDALSNHNTFILAKHGSLTLGRDLQQSFNRLENLEHNAKIAMIALSGGQLPSLPTPEITALEQSNVAIQSVNHPIHGESHLRISDEEVLIEQLHSHCLNIPGNNPAR